MSGDFQKAAHGEAFLISSLHGSPVLKRASPNAEMDVTLVRGDLSNVLFHVLLKRAIYEASNRTSEELFVQLEADIDRETRLKQDHSPQFRGAPRAVESLCRTHVASISFGRVETVYGKLDC